MYNKVKKCLESMGYDFVECESMELSIGITLSNGFWLNKSYHKEVYIEISESGDIDTWDYKSGKHEYTIKKEEIYIMMFKLAWVLNN